MKIYVNNTTNIVEGQENEDSECPQGCHEITVAKFPFYWGVEWYTYVNNAFVYTARGLAKVTEEYGIPNTEVYFAEAGTIIAKRNAVQREENMLAGTTFDGEHLPCSDQIVFRLAFAKTVLTIDPTKTFNWKFPSGWKEVNKDNIDTFILALNTHIETEFDNNKILDEEL